MFRRAEERMTLKHKNSGKWVRHQQHRKGQLEPGTRAAIEEQLRIGDVCLYIKHQQLVIILLFSNFGEKSILLIVAQKKNLTVS